MTRTNTSLSKKALALALSAAVASSFSFPALALAAEAEGATAATATDEAATQLPFTASVEGAPVSASSVSYAEGAYVYNPYGDKTWVLPSYSVALPANTPSVSVSFEGEYLAYNYRYRGSVTHTDDDYIAGAVANPSLGNAAFTVSTDANGDYVPDAILVQTPYIQTESGEWDSQRLFVIFFDVELGPQVGESATVDLGGGASASVKVTAAAEGGKAGAVAISGLSGSAASVSIPSSVTIGSSTYAVTSVAASAFKGKTALRSVSLPASVTKIGAGAFRGCSKLSSLSIGKKVASIGTNVVSGCSKLKTVTVKSAKLTKKGVRNLVKGSAVTTLACPGLSKSVKAKYATWAKTYNKKVAVK
ncbi:MAG: leucine-rich repeat domain-containing protein [Coriobacteriales bacterium]